MNKEIKQIREQINKFDNFILVENITDYILDKINKYGIENLSKQDKDVLNGLYIDTKINVSEIENEIFNLLCDGESEETILDDIEDDYNIHSYYIKPIYEYCIMVYKKVKTIFNNLEEKPNMCDFFRTLVSYRDEQISSSISSFNNTIGYTGNNGDWSIGKAFKESFEDEDIYFEDEEYSDIKNKIITCFKL